MIAYLIDPKTRTMAQVEYSGDLDELYKLLGCNTVDAVEVNSHGDTLWVDDEGLFVPREDLYLFYMAGSHAATPDALAGRALLTGCNAKGNTCAPHYAQHEYFDNLYFQLRQGTHFYVKAQK